MIDTWSFSGCLIAVEKNTYQMNNFNIFCLWYTEISSTMHKDSKLTKYVRNYNEGILFDGFF